MGWLDAEMEGGTDQAEALPYDRYQAAEIIYIQELDPMTLAELVIDNTDFERPLLVRSEHQ